MTDADRKSAKNVNGILIGRDVLGGASAASAQAQILAMLQSDCSFSLTVHREDDRWTVGWTPLDGSQAAMVGQGSTLDEALATAKRHAFHQAE